MICGLLETTRLVDLRQRILKILLRVGNLLVKPLKIKINYQYEM